MHTRQCSAKISSPCAPTFTHDNKRGPASLEELAVQNYMVGVPTNPVTGSDETWQLEGEAARLSLDDSAPAGGTDVHSNSDAVSLDGTAYTRC